MIAGPVRALKDHKTGRIPVVTSACKNNGIAKWLDIPEDMHLSHCITISTTHNTHPCEAYWHPYKFSAVENLTLVLKPISKLLDYPLAIFYLCEAVTAGNAWRYSYARPVKLDEIKVEVPVTPKGEPDIPAKSNIVKSQLPKE